MPTDPQSGAYHYQRSLPGLIEVLGGQLDSHLQAYIPNMASDERRNLVEQLRRVSIAFSSAERDWWAATDQAKADGVYTDDDTNGEVGRRYRKLREESVRTDRVMAQDGELGGGCGCTCVPEHRTWREHAVASYGSVEAWELAGGCIECGFSQGRHADECRHFQGFAAYEIQGTPRGTADGHRVSIQKTEGEFANEEMARYGHRSRWLLLVCPGDPLPGDHRFGAIPAKRCMACGHRLAEHTLPEGTGLPPACGADWRVCLEHGNTLRSSGDKTWCTHCDRELPGGAARVCVEDATHRLVHESGEMLVCAGHAKAAEVQLEGAQLIPLEAVVA